MHDDDDIMIDIDDIDLKGILTSDSVYNFSDILSDNSITIGNSTATSGFWAPITDTQVKKGIVSIDGEELDAMFIKRLKILMDIMSTDERFKDIMQDIDTQIAFEKLSEDK